MKYIPLISCLFIVLFLGCNEVNPNGEKEVRTFVKQWNDSHTQLKSAFLNRDYMEVVNYYIDAQNKDFVTCKGGDCNSVIVFSNTELKITIKGAYKSQLENLSSLFY